MAVLYLSPIIDAFSNVSVFVASSYFTMPLTPGMKDRSLQFLEVTCVSAMVRS